MENFKTFIKKVFEYRKFILWKTRTLYKQRVFLPFLRTHSKIKAGMVKPKGPFNLVIIDDFLPNILSAFRANEFAYLLKNVEGSALFSTIATKIHSHKPHYDYYIQSTSHFEKYKEEYCRRYSVNPDQIKPFFDWTRIETKLAYVVFLTNAFYLIEYFEKNNIRFILELYPGGGMAISSPEVDTKLKRVLGSPMLQKVFTTQKTTYNYLLINDFCDKDKIVFKYGGILSSAFQNIAPKKFKYPATKNTIDICFTAAKYIEKGIDKGYDIFIETAHLLLKQSKIYHFHIVGGFNADDIQIAESFKEHFHFYGHLKTHDFIKFYENKDIFVSPNRPFILGKGAYDGFPTAAAAEAALNGLCVLASDSLEQNVILSDGEDYISINNSANDVLEKILYLTRYPEEIYRIGLNGGKTLLEDNDTQLPFRLKLINTVLND